jgi:hypothetical protein
VGPGNGVGDYPLCIRDYASGGNVIYSVDPVLPDRRLSAIPVRIIIDRHGRVRHVHVLRAFPEQAAKITDALMQWRFKPYMRNGESTEVETGIVFGAQPGRQPVRTASDDARDTN